MTHVLRVLVHDSESVLSAGGTLVLGREQGGEGEGRGQAMTGGLTSDPSEGPPASSPPPGAARAPKEAGRRGRTGLSSLCLTGHHRSPQWV